MLVLVLVASAIANRRKSHTSQMRPIVIMYLVGTWLLFTVGQYTTLSTLTNALGIELEPHLKGWP